MAGAATPGLLAAMMMTAQVGSHLGPSDKNDPEQTGFVPWSRVRLRDVNRMQHGPYGGGVSKP
jgi:hypothetical protein